MQQYFQKNYPKTLIEMLAKKLFEFEEADIKKMLEECFLKFNPNTTPTLNQIFQILNDCKHQREKKVFKYSFEDEKIQHISTKSYWEDMCLFTQRILSGFDSKKDKFNFIISWSNQMNQKHPGDECLKTMIAEIIHDAEKELYFSEKN